MSGQQQEEGPAGGAGVQEEESPAPAGQPGDGAADGIVEFDERRAKMERMRAEGIDPYPAVTLWNTRTRIAELQAAHDPAALGPGEHAQHSYVIAGRLISRRVHGRRAFLDVRDLSGQMQVLAQQ